MSSSTPINAEFSGHQALAVRHLRAALCGFTGHRIRFGATRTKPAIRKSSPSTKSSMSRGSATFFRYCFPIRTEGTVDGDRFMHSPSKKPHPPACLTKNLNIKHFALHKFPPLERRRKGKRLFFLHCRSMVKIQSRGNFKRKSV